MTIAELFVNLGVKGSDKAISALEGVGKGVKGIASMSLEAKAALVGMMYGLERMMAGSAKLGTNLTNTSDIMGVSTKELQQWGYAAQNAGSSAEDFQGSLKSAQKIMSDSFLFGKGVSGMPRLAQLTGGISPQDVKMFAEKPLELMKRLQQYVQKETNLNVRNTVLDSFGVSDSMKAALLHNAFDPSKIASAPFLSDKTLRSNAQVDSAMKNLGTQIQIAFAQFTGKHGKQFVQDLSDIVKGLTRMAEVLTVIGEKLGIFKLPAMVIEGWTKIFEGADSVFSGRTTKKEAAKALMGTLVDDFTGKEPMLGKGNRQSEKEYQEKLYQDLLAPKMQPKGGPGANNTEFNLQIQFNGDGSNHKEVASTVNKAVRDAYRQMQAQVQVV